MRPDGDQMTTYRQSTFCKAAIEPDQITLCWRSDATRKRFVCAPMAMLETYDVQFPLWLRCRRPLLIRLWYTRSDYGQIATCWLQSYKSRRRSDAIIDILYPHSTRRRSLAICAIWKSATDRIVWGLFGGYQRYDYDQLALRWRPSSDLWDLVAT